jgi:uncharacterized protein
MYYILFYETNDNYIKNREPYRKEHLLLAQEALDKGTLVMGGALSDPSDKAVLIFKSDNSLIVEEFVKNDPYVKNGLIKKWQVRKWNVVISKE